MSDMNLRIGDLGPASVYNIYARPPAPSLRACSVNSSISRRVREAPPGTRMALTVGCLNTLKSVSLKTVVRSMSSSP